MDTLTLNRPPLRPKLREKCMNCPHRPPVLELTPWVLGKLTLDRESCRVSWDGKDLDMTYTEYALVLEFIQHVGQYRSYRRLYDVMRGEGFLAGIGANGFHVNVRSAIKRLRRKLHSVGCTDTIENGMATGYRWVAVPQDRTITR